MELEPRLRTERWIAWARIAAVAFAMLEVGIFSTDYPPGYEGRAWFVTGGFAAGALLLLAAAYRCRPEHLAPVGAAALVFDLLVVAAFATIFSYEYGSPARWAVIAVVVEGALRYGLLGGVLVPLALVPFLAFVEEWRASRFGPPDFRLDRVTFPAGLLLLTGASIGWLVGRLRAETALAGSRAREAEELRDELGRRADTIDAANRCARALGSSLVLEEAFGAFIRELRGLIPFARAAIVLAEGDNARMMAAAGEGVETVFPSGSKVPIAGTVFERVIRTHQAEYRERMPLGEFPEEGELIALGLLSRVVAPLLAGVRPIGILAVSRRAPAAFSAQEVELAELLGRLVGTAVQNIRSYDAERRTVEELTRLSALRADFVSLVSHELRSPIASVSGAAQTLRRRGHELSPHQQESFLAMIEEESARLGRLVAEVLDTSLIETGAFAYSFAEVDIADLVHVTVAASSSPVVAVLADVPDALPPVRGDRERLRQVLANLVDNAVKYSPEGGAVDVRVNAANGLVAVAVHDDGPGIAAADQVVIFEKFGRAASPGIAKPGSGLGLFIARSIAEAHGGSLDVESGPGGGATFTLSLPTAS